MIMMHRNDFVPVVFAFLHSPTHPILFRSSDQLFLSLRSFFIFVFISDSVHAYRIYVVHVFYSQASLCVCDNVLLSLIHSLSLISRSILRFLVRSSVLLCGFRPLWIPPSLFIVFPSFLYGFQSTLLSLSASPST